MFYNIDSVVNTLKDRKNVILDGFKAVGMTNATRETVHAQLMRVKLLTAFMYSFTPKKRRGQIGSLSGCSAKGKLDERWLFLTYKPYFGPCRVGHIPENGPWSKNLRDCLFRTGSLRKEPFHSRI